MMSSQYAYDAMGRRIGKYDAAAMETTYYYYNDQWQILAEYTADTTCRQWYTYGNYIDEVLSVNKSPTLLLLMRYYAHDHLYNPAALVISTGVTVLERYEYDAYGKVTITARGADNLWYTADDVTLSASAYYNPFTFTGRQLDILDNGNLRIIYHGDRYYACDLGRWISMYSGNESGRGINPYWYALTMNHYDDLVASTKGNLRGQTPFMDKS